jgi:NTP pyrophosphatase (non-canonical NTP hydrolase)
MVLDETSLDWTIETLVLDANSFAGLTWNEVLMAENMRRAAGYLSEMKKEKEQIMDMDKYQTESLKTAVYPKGQGKLYTVLGLANEAGEAAGVVKKIIRQDVYLPSCLTEEENDRMNQEKIIAELGDVLWYLAAVAKEYNLKMSDVAQYNLDKLKDRAERGVIKGSGDNR